MEKKQKIKRVIAEFCIGVYIGACFSLALFDQKIWVAILTLVPAFILFFPDLLQLILSVPNMICERKSEKIIMKKKKKSRGRKIRNLSR